MPACYTNITPPTLPTWDTAANPYYLVSFNYSKGAIDWSDCRVTYSASPFEYVDGKITNPETCYYQFYTDGSWVGTWLPANVSYKPGINSEIYMRIWTSHDITGYMKAGGITPGAWLMNHKDFWTGVAMGLKSKGLPAKQDKLPIAYLYNGVQLPPLPEVEGYMVIGNIYTSTLLKVSDSPSYYDNGTVQTPTPVRYWKYTDGAWVESGTVTGENPAFPSTRTYWANHDIVSNEDGSVFLAASEPVPVYGGDS